MHMNAFVSIIFVFDKDISEYKKKCLPSKNWAKKTMKQQSIPKNFFNVILSCSLKTKMT